MYRSTGKCGAFWLNYGARAYKTKNKIITNASCYHLSSTQYGTFSEVWNEFLFAKSNIFPFNVYVVTFVRIVGIHSDQFNAQIKREYCIEHDHFWKQWYLIRKLNQQIVIWLYHFSQRLHRPNETVRMNIDVNPESEIGFKAKVVRHYASHFFFVLVQLPAHRWHPMDIIPWPNAYKRKIFIQIIIISWGDQRMYYY